MSKRLWFVFGALLAVSLLWVNVCQADQASVQQKMAAVQLKDSIIQTQWYDTFEQGFITNEADAAALISQAQQAITAGNYPQADALLTQADQILSNFVTPDLPASWMVQHPLSFDSSILGNIHKGDLNELKSIDLYTAPRFNTWFNFSGKGSDGNLYGIYACVNHHGTGHPLPRVMFVISCNAWTDKPNNLEVLDLMVVPTRQDLKDRLVWEAKDGDKYLKWTIKKEGTTVYYRDPQREVNLTMKTDYSFWYNRGMQPAEILPGSFTVGFEQPGLVKGTITKNDKTVTLSGGGEFENYFVKGASYRDVLIKYGNEYWLTFAGDQISGLLVITMANRDCGLYINGQYVIPKEFHITNNVAKKSFTVTADTAAGPVVMNFDFWGNNPALYEYWGTMNGTVAGQPITNGYAWVEHVPRGGVNLTGAASPTVVPAMRKAVPSN